MTDLNPEIWDNPTLGAAAQNENLDRLTKQAIEDRSARIEGREPREVVHDNNHPGYTPPVAERTGTTPSNFQTVHFADEQQSDVPVDSTEYSETAGPLADETSEEQAESTQVEPEESDSAESPATDSSEESDSTQWT